MMTLSTVFVLAITYIAFIRNNYYLYCLGMVMVDELLASLERSSLLIMHSVTNSESP